MRDRWVKWDGKKSQVGVVARDRNNTHLIISNLFALFLKSPNYNVSSCIFEIISKINICS